MATSIAMLGLAFLTLSFRRFKLLNICIGFILIYLSTATHQSCLLILAAAIIAYLYRNTKIYCIFWICCILLSLIFTESLKTYLADSITDARMLNYLSKDADETMFSHTGFRWDFILYSAVPIVLGWYVIIKKGVRDVTYSFLLNVYIFANSFWCLINSAAYSNRFAYLSWFLMPVVICYPMLKFRVFKNQGMVCALFLLGQVIFNLIV